MSQIVCVMEVLPCRTPRYPFSLVCELNCHRLSASFLRLGSLKELDLLILEMSETGSSVRHREGVGQIVDKKFPIFLFFKSLSVTRIFLILVV